VGTNRVSCRSGKSVVKAAAFYYWQGGVFLLSLFAVFQWEMGRQHFSQYILLLSRKNITSNHDQNMQVPLD